MTRVIEQHYRIANLTVRLSAPTCDIADIMGHLLGGFSVSPQQSPHLDIAVSLCRDQRIVLRMGNAPPQIFKTLDQFASHLEWRLICQATENMSCLGIHAGAIAFDNHAIVFPGTSGSGKTTLTLSCLRKGASLLSDEIALIDPASSGVRPFLRVLCVKHTGLDLLPALALPQQAVRMIGATACIRSRAFSCVPSDPATPIKTLVFPRYGPNAATTLTPIPRAQALAHLLKQTMNRRRHAHTCLAILGSLVETAACYSLSMGDLNEAVARLIDIPS